LLVHSLTHLLVLSRCRCISAPAYFDPTTIAHNLGDNWALKASNVRKLLRNLEHYFHEGLQKDAAFDFSVPAITREADATAIADLVELVAAAAVTCPEKSTYVSRIMSMGPDSQVEMKAVLQASLQRLSDYEAEEEEGDENELVFGQDERDLSAEHDPESSKHLFAANHLKDGLEEELSEAKRELVALKSQMTIQAEDSEKAQSKLKALVEDLQDRLVRRQDELIQVEEDLQTATAELEETKSKLAEVEEQKAQLADDLDVASAKAQQLHKAEATVVAYKKKLESVGMMNQQMTDLEDQAAKYLRQIMELESEVKKSAALQKTVNELQEEVSRLQKDKTVNASSTKSSAAEIADLKSKLNASESAKKMYEEELSELRAQQEHELVTTPSGSGLEVSMAPTAEQREKMTRLQIENEQLRKEVGKLKTSQVAGVSVAAEAKSTPASDSTPMAVAVSADESVDVSALQAQIDLLREELAAKEKENVKISSDKDKLEAYTKRTLAKFQDKYLVALQECKAKLKEKQDKIEILESRSASERTAQKREERLLSSTIYELGLAIMQNRLKER